MRGFPKTAKLLCVMVIVVTLISSSSLFTRKAEGIVGLGAGGFLILKYAAAAGTLQVLLTTTQQTFMIQQSSVPSTLVPPGNSWTIVAPTEKEAIENATHAYHITHFLESLYDDIREIIYGEEDPPTIRVRRHLGSSSDVVEIPLGGKVWQTDTASGSTKSRYEGWYLEFENGKKIGPIPWDVISVKITGA